MVQAIIHPAACRSHATIAVRLYLLSALTVCGLVLALGLGSATAAAHNSNGWYWTERKAERRLLNSYSDIATVSCLGLAPEKRTRSGGRKYSHFTCSLVLDDGTGFSPTLEVLGRRKARVLYNFETDIIR